jgi:hypothetical protein
MARRGSRPMGQNRPDHHRKDEGCEREEPRNRGRDCAVGRRGAVDLACAKRLHDVLCELVENAPLSADDRPRQTHRRHDGGKDNANGDSPANEDKACSHDRHSGSIAFQIRADRAGYTLWCPQHSAICPERPVSASA